MKYKDDEVCEICFSADTEDSPMVFCDTCESCFHMECAHLEDKDIEGEVF